MEQTLPVRLIATDIDRTLLDSAGKMPEENRKAILEAQKRGIVFALATGRFAGNALMLLEEYGLRAPIVACNGAHITDETFQTLFIRMMAPETAEEVCRRLNAVGSDYFAFGPDFLARSRPGLIHHSEAAYADRMKQLSFTYEDVPGDLAAMCRRGILKFYVFNNVPLENARAAVEGLPGISVTRSSRNNIEIVQEGIDKGSGVCALASLYGIPMSQVMTIGDEENDIPMIAAAGWGVAMGNASAETARAARIVTDTNDDCGFARAIRKYAFKEDL